MNKITVKALLKDVEKFIREVIAQTGEKIEASLTANDKIILGFHLPSGVLWGSLTLLETNTNTLVITEINDSALLGYCANNFVAFTDVKQRFQQGLDELVLKIQEKFGKPDEAKAKPKGKRGNTLGKEKKIIAEYNKQLKRKTKDFRGATHRDEAPKVRVTAQEVIDGIGDKIGVGERYVQKVLKDYKAKIKA